MEVSGTQEVEEVVSVEHIQEEPQVEPVKQEEETVAEAILPITEAESTEPVAEKVVPQKPKLAKTESSSKAILQSKISIGPKYKLVATQCKGITKSGNRCKRMTRLPHGYCIIHARMALA